MNEPVFIDSNIWLYSFLRQDEEKRKAAKTLIKSCIRKFTFVSTQIINEVCFNLKKNNVPESEIKEILTSFYSDYKVIYFTEAIMCNASDLREKYSISFWDSLVVAAALTRNCKILYSEDMQNGQIFEGQLKIKNPFK
jgi:predicted nucleic acid-binding protein